MSQTEQFMFPKTDLRNRLHSRIQFAVSESGGVMNNSKTHDTSISDTPITIEKLEEALFRYSPFESMIRSYYLKHQRFMPQDEFPAELLHSYAVSPTDLRTLTGFVAPDTSPRFSYHTFETFSEPQYFSPDYDIYIQKQPRYSSSPPQSHPYYEICYQYTGTSTQKLSVDNAEETLLLDTGDFIFIPAAQAHAVTIDSDSLLLNIGIRTSTFTRAFSHNIPEDSILRHFFSSLLTTEQESIQYIVFHTNNDVAMRQQIQNLSLTYCMHTLYSQQIMNLQLSILFMNLLQNYSYNTKLSNSTGGIAEKIPAVMQYIEQQYTSVTTQDIARHFGYSCDYLNQVFKKMTSFTLGETLMNLKMQKAASLLTSTTLPVSAVAEYLGYQDTTNLIRSFKKQYKMTPAQYRKKYYRL